VDGFHAKTNTVYQFQGCYWHGHQCRLTQKAEKHDPELQSERRTKTETNIAYLRELGYEVIDIRECDWYDHKKCYNIKQFLDEHHPTPNFWNTISKTIIINAITNGSLFGMVECSIEVPPSLKEHFSEMTPIFKNAEISINDIGPTMKDYANTHGFLKQPRRSLIGSYIGKKILLTTPLLKWYLEHGLIITEIFQVIQYDKSTCFEEFGNRVANARRDGDGDDDSLVILADTNKLIGNSAHGKTITDKERHVDIKYPNENEVPKYIENPRFRQLDEIGNGHFEVTMAKNKINLDLPIQIGYFVYCYAKLRMLEFYFDFVDKFVDRKDFEYVEMDTDSAYIALSGPTLESVLKPDMVDQFYDEREQWLPSDYCTAHKNDFKTSEQAGESWTRANKNADDFCGDCLARKQFTKRSPGLFKVEWEGKGIIALCSKTFFGFGTDN
jgi:hypothetical protein